MALPCVSLSIYSAHAAVSAAVTVYFCSSSLFSCLVALSPAESQTALPGTHFSVLPGVNLGESRFIRVSLDCLG